MIRQYSYCRRKGSLREALSVFALLLIASQVYGQHAKREVAFSFAIAGQRPVAVTGDERSGFWRDPVIFNLRVQATTDYITSVSLFVEHMRETSERQGLWSDVPNSAQPPAYNANIAEHLTMTLFGVEAARTVLRTGDFRLALTVGAGYGLGGARADVRNILTNEKQVFESCDIWHGVFLSSSLRGRYTIHQEDTYDVGLTASLRAWGFPTIGPFGDCRSSYNGPGFTALFEIGYLVGVSLGLF